MAFPLRQYHAEYMNGRIGKKCCLAAAGGVLAALSLPGFGVSGLVYVALVPLFAALDRAESARRGALVGFTFGAAFFLLDLRWVLAVMRFNPLVVPGYVILAGYLALPLALVGGLLVWLRRRRGPWIWLLLAPALFVLAEFARTLGAFGTGFSMLHHALFRVPWLIQSASVLGPWSVTAFIVAVNVALFLAVRQRRPRLVLIALGLLGAQAAFALLPNGLDAGTPELDVALVSSDVDQAVKLDARNLDELAARYMALADEALESSPDLVVFPESFLPAYILNHADLYAMLADRARGGGTEILFGSGEYIDREIYNSVVLVDREGAIAGRYHMVRPVPFGEYVPGRALLEWVGLGDWAKSLLWLDLSRGSGYAPLSGYGTPICFESVFPSGARSFVKNGASLLVTLTNDAWFDGSSELRAHFAAAVFRAVENRRWIVQVANGGFSGVVDAAGRIRSSIAGEGVLIERGVQRLSGFSFYTRWGDAPLLGAAALILAAVLMLGATRWRKQHGE